MIQLILKYGNVVATHEMHQDVRGLYPGCEIVTYSGVLPADPESTAPLADPRTEEEKKRAYKDQRRLAYPTIEEQLDMLYHDRLDKTNTWTDAITNVKDQFPKPLRTPESE